MPFKVVLDGMHIIENDGDRMRRRNLVTWPRIVGLSLEGLVFITPYQTPDMVCD